MKLLVKEIKSRTGELHFRRWRLLYTPWFAIYIHGIYRSDEDKHPHSHPWNFLSLILKGAYRESVWIKQGWHRPDARFPGTFTRIRWLGSPSGHSRSSYHKIEICEGPVYTLVFTLGRHSTWGYLVDDEYVPEDQYRKMKHEVNNEEMDK